MQTKAQSSRDAIERLYIGMRYLFYRGKYRPNGSTGRSLKQLLLSLNPEIYGSMADQDKIELNGLMYVLDRLPKGLVQCPYIYLTAAEGYQQSGFTPIIPKKRRRMCYRIDEDQMNIEVTRGRSEIYDILTHLTFLYHEADKIRNRAFNKQTHKMERVWEKIQDVALAKKELNRNEREVALMHLSDVLGRTFEETKATHKHFSEKDDIDRFFRIVYWMGTISSLDHQSQKKREIVFTSTLRNFVGHHTVGENWAINIKETLAIHGLQNRSLHVISSNMHSVMNTLYAHEALGKEPNCDYELFNQLSDSENDGTRKKVIEYANKNGLVYLPDASGANVNVQIIDLKKLKCKTLPFNLKPNNTEDVLIVMDYAFGEQAFELMDELCKPHDGTKMDIQSVSVMGKAGVLKGNKGDIILPNSHVFEGTTDNYPFKNELKLSDFADKDLQAFEGSMLTVLGTSLQNKDLLLYFKNSSWACVGLEMEGAHYQKAIQVASKIRGHICADVRVMYAYYASDNPLETGSTLASGGLGMTGVKPTYLITQKILKQIL